MYKVYYQFLKYDEQMNDKNLEKIQNKNYQKCLIIFKLLCLFKSQASIGRKDKQ